MGVERWFYRGEEEFRRIYGKLKLTPCPYCRVVGALILHGFLRGYDEGDPRQRSVRARRIFCSNRNSRVGCGRTFSVWIAEKIRRLSLTASGLWKFLKQIAAGASKVQAIRDLDCHLSDTALYRIWKRFDLSQSHLRTALAQLCPAPEVASDQPAAQVVAHLQTAFPESSSPIADFQRTMRRFFL